VDSLLLLEYYFDPRYFCFQKYLTLGHIAIIGWLGPKAAHNADLALGADAIGQVPDEQ
jgi:hypothetical protein